MQDSSKDNTQYDATHYDPPRYDPPPQDTPQQSTPQPSTPQQSTPPQSTPPAGASRQGNQNTPQYNAYYNPPPQMKRPLGVTILSILIGIEGLGALLIGILAIGALSAIGARFGAHGHAALSSAFFIIGWILGILPLVIGIIILVVAVGLFLLKSWAFWITIVASAIFLLRQIYELFQPRDSYTLIIIGLIIPVIVLLYLLLDPNVRRSFHIGGAGRRERLV
jgi:hypothetical protein